MDNDYLVSFGRRVRKLRQQTGLSQEKFALTIGVPFIRYLTPCLH